MDMLTQILSVPSIARLRSVVVCRNLCPHLWCILFLRCVKDTFDKQSKIKKKEHKQYLSEVEKHLGFISK